MVCQVMNDMVQQSSSDNRYSPAASSIPHQIIVPKSLPLTLLLTLATYNVFGLSRSEKQHQLDKDVIRFNLEIVGLQETKVRQFSFKTQYCPVVTG